MLQFRLLGALDLRGPDASATAGLLAQPRRLALLAYLAAAHPHGFHRRDHLLTIFWPELDQTRARAALSQALHVLRRALGPGVLLTRGNEEVGLDRTRIITDAEQFEQAADAGAHQDADRLYRGDLLPAFHLSESPEFERWLDETRARLRERAATIARSEADAAVRRGENAAAAEWLRRVLELAPQDESVLRRLMELHMANGDRAAALLAYDEFATALHRELEVEPSPVTMALMEKVRAVTAPATLRAPRPHTPGTSISAEPPEPSPVVPAAPLSHRRPWAVFAAVALLLIVVTGGLIIRGRPSAPSSDRVAVLPFVIRGDSSLAYLREGLVDLLSTKLDGLGSFQVVDPAIVLTAMKGSADKANLEALPAGGADLARQVGAELFIVGRVVTLGEAIELSASLFDSRGRRLALVTSVAASDSLLPAAVDQLARELLATRWSAPADRLQRLAVTSTSSPVALRAYLDGERAFRAGQYTQARDAFLAAVAADSLYALAWYRLSLASGWVADASSYQSAAHRALALADRLTEHDRLLVEAHLAYIEGSADEAERRYRRILGQYPDDPEAWYNLGEVLFHGNPLRGRPLASAEEAFERTEALTGHSTEALGHLYYIRLLAGDFPAAAALQQTLLDRYPAGEWRRQLYQILDVAVRPDSNAEAALLADAAHSEGGQLWIVARALAVYTDRLDLADTLAGLMQHHSRSVSDRIAGHALRVELQLARGQWRSAREETLQLRQLDRATGDELLATIVTLPWAAMTAEEYRDARKDLDRWLPRPGSPGTGIQPTPTPELRDELQLFYELLCGIALGDTASVGQITRRMERRDSTRPNPAPVALLPVARAAQALARGDPAMALAQLDSLPATGSYAASLLQYSHGYQRFLRAEALAGLGRHEEALGWFRSFRVIFGFDVPYRGPALFREAESLEALGRREEAREAYRHFLALYAESDDRFEPLLRRARERAAEVGQ